MAGNIWTKKFFSISWWLQGNPIEMIICEATLSDQLAKETDDIGLPLVVQIGFAGNRHLFDVAASGEAFSELTCQLQKILEGCLKRLESNLQKNHSYFLCGISQLAIGADTLFTKACRELNIPQRLFLPQPWDEYVNAINSKGEADFPDGDKTEACQLRDSPHVIHERVVSDATDRHDRFEDANLEIVRVSDILICLVRSGAEPQRGGTRDLLECAKRRKKPVLLLTISEQQGKVELHQEWVPGLRQQRQEGVATCITTESGIDKQQQEFTLSPLPQSSSFFRNKCEIADKGWPDFKQYSDALKNSSTQARAYQKKFELATAVIIGTHVVATACAAFALKAHKVDILLYLLALEIGLLASGLMVHLYLPHSKALKHWALARLIAETKYSVEAAGALHVYLEYLFKLPFPAQLRPLLRTISVMHLRHTNPRCQGGNWKVTREKYAQEKWKSARDEYVNNRLAGVERGQILYSGRKSKEAEWQFKLARFAFLLCSAAALLGTLLKILLYCNILEFPHAFQEMIIADCGLVSGILPSLAVGVLSLAAAFDLEARHHTFSEMHDFLVKQQAYLEAAESPREFEKLVVETESHLLGETVNWFARRSYTGG